MTLCMINERRLHWISFYTGNWTGQMLHKVKKKTSIRWLKAAKNIFYIFKPVCCSNNYSLMWPEVYVFGVWNGPA